MPRVDAMMGELVVSYSCLSFRSRAGLDQRELRLPHTNVLTQNELPLPLRRSPHANGVFNRRGGQDLVPRHYPLAMRSRLPRRPCPRCPRKQRHPARSQVLLDRPLFLPSLLHPPRHPGRRHRLFSRSR